MVDARERMNRELEAQMRGISHHMSDFPPIKICIIQWPFFGVFVLDNISQIRRIHNGNLAIKLTNLSLTRAWSALWRLASEDKSSLLYSVLSIPELEEKINKYVYYHSFMNYTVNDDGRANITGEKLHGVFVSSSLYRNGLPCRIFQKTFDGDWDHCLFHVRDIIYNLPVQLFESEGLSDYPVPDDERPSNILAFGNDGKCRPEICFIMEDHDDFIDSICSTYKKESAERTHPGQLEIDYDSEICWKVGEFGMQNTPTQFFDFDIFSRYLADFNKSIRKFEGLSTRHGRDVFLPPYLMFTMQISGVATADIMDRGSQIELQEEGCVNPDTGVEYVDEHDILGNNFTSKGRILGKDVSALFGLIEGIKSVGLEK